MTSLVCDDDDHSFVWLKFCKYIIYVIHRVLKRSIYIFFKLELPVFEFVLELRCLGLAIYCTAPMWNEEEQHIVLSEKCQSHSQLCF